VTVSSHAATRRIRPRFSGALGGPLVHLDRAGSTNDHARRLAIDGAPDGTVVVAEEQTAGRGRQGRSWAAPRGRALTLSLVRRLGPAAPPAELELLPLVVALAVCDASEAVAPVSCLIKWPNDVWIGERKLAGILIETRSRDGWAVVGIGLNVDTDRQELDGELRETATSLRIESGAPVDRDHTLAALLAALAAKLRELQLGRTEALLTAYRERDLLEGRSISWSARTRTMHGEARGIDERGNLIVFTDEGDRLALDAGEVHIEPERRGG
jgi:BirA family transcriptional regulator, biotin operon repressor / biotin---[acetyl-CoA-carboxylase] ligase